MPKLCTIESCDRPLLARGWCSMHYARWKKYGDPQEHILAARQGGNRPRKFCVVEGCDRPVNGHGHCMKHYQQKWSAGIEIPGANWKRCSVDGCESFVRSHGYCIKHLARFKAHGDPLALKIAEQGTGSISAEGYRKIKVDGRSRFEHRVVMERVLGRPLELRETVHHRNGDKLDNRPENLELWTGNHPTGVRHDEAQAHCPTCTCFEH